MINGKMKINKYIIWSSHLKSNDLIWFCCKHKILVSLIKWLNSLHHEKKRLGYG